MGVKTEAKNEIVVYQPNETVRLEVRVEADMVWLNRQQLAQLFGRDVKTIGKHIANALQEELAPAGVFAGSVGLAAMRRTVAKSATVDKIASGSTVAKFATVQKEGRREVVRQVEYYNLEMITSVGYRVKSPQGVLFRRWANQVLKEYLLRGYAVNARLNQQYGGLSVRTSLNFHDRFLVTDDKRLFLIGASLKDLGTKCFAFAKLDSSEIPNLKARI